MREREADKLPSPNHCDSRDFLLVFKNLPDDDEDISELRQMLQIEGRSTGVEPMELGLYAIFSNIFENIEGRAHFRIREYSREYRRPLALSAANMRAQGERASLFIGIAASSSLPISP